MAEPKTASHLVFPSIYLLAANVSDEERKQLAENIPSLTTDASKAEFFAGKVSKKERAKFELRRLGIVTIDERSLGTRPKATQSAPAAKRRKLDEPTPALIVISSSSEDESTATVAMPPGSPLKVVKLAWLTDSIARGEVVPLDTGYVVYEGRKIRTEKPGDKPTPRTPRRDDTTSVTADILRRAQESSRTQPSTQQQQQVHSSPGPQTYRQHIGSSQRRTFNTPTQKPTLVLTTTSEHDEAQALPPIPEFLHTTYSCQRPTPIHPPNERFVDELKKIRAARQLMGDKIGIRAYSTAIATVAAYPYKLCTPAEVSRLPGCGPKIAELFRQFQDTGGHVREADDDEADARLSVLRLFDNIWGVAEATARSFYNKGWRDLDDVIEFGWKELTRVQQIGVKYYDELQEPMTRAEVEAIADRVLTHANAIRPDYQMVIVGGYRRGKELSGDVDVILSHRDEAATSHLIGRLVLSLEQAGLITHTLTLSTANSERGQEAVSWKGNAPQHGLTSASVGGTGFDTLDKALVVWQDPMEDVEVESKKGKEEGGVNGDNAVKPKNTNLHRRVDIIVSPWKTVGCAMLGWSGGTTFQRDLRRYCKYERGLKFDSSGVRSKVDGSWVDLESFSNDPAPDMLTAERRVFSALGLEYRPPTERCTG